MLEGVVIRNNLHSENTWKKVSNIASDEHAMENNHVCYVMEFKRH